MSEHDPDDVTRPLPSGQQPPAEQAGWGQQPPPPGTPYGQPGPPPPPGAPYGQPAAPYATPGMPYGVPGFDPAAPFGRHPRTGEPYGEKSKVIAGILQLLIGTLGIGRFYTGHTGIAIAQLVTCGGCGIWALIDGIMILVGDDQRDADGRLLRS